MAWKRIEIGSMPVAALSGGVPKRCFVSFTIFSSLDQTILSEVGR